MAHQRISGAIAYAKSKSTYSSKASSRSSQATPRSQEDAPNEVPGHWSPGRAQTTELAELKRSDLAPGFLSIPEPTWKGLSGLGCILKSW